MADEIAPEQVSDFDAALAELAAELARASPVEKRAILDRVRPKVGAGEHGLPYLPTLPPQGFGELRNSLSPEAERAMINMGLPTSAGPAIDTLLRVEPITREFTGIPQVGRASDAVRDAMIDPSVPTVTNAGVQTAMAVGRPMAALKTLAGGYGAAAVSDIGGSPVTEAEAQTPLTRTQRREMEMERQRSERQAEIDRRASETSARLGRESADAATKREIEAEAQRKDRAEYDRAVATAEAAAAKEMARDRRFSDTAVGQVYDKTGGLAPAIAGFAGAKLSRLATGPGETLPGQVFKDYALPLTTGTISGGITANLPLAYNALATEPDNPKRRMYEALAENLPAAHPRRQEAVDRLQDFKSLPEANPIRSAASAEFYDPQKMQERLIMGGVEGFGGGLFGTDLVRAIGRGATALGNRWRGPAGAQPTGVSIDAPLSGTLVETNALLRPTTVGAASSAGTPQASGAVVPNALSGPPRGQLPSPEASPSRSASDLPPGVKRDINGVAYDAHTGQKIKKRLLDAPQQSKPTPTTRAAKAKEEPTSEKITDPNDPAYWENRLTRGQ
jgi:hypothetical protein